MPRNSENRTGWLTVRLTDAEVAEVKGHADVSGISASELIRRRVLGQRLPKGSAPEINRAAWADLARTAGNLNQLTHHLNIQNLKGGEAMVESGEVKNLVRTLVDQVQKVRLELLGASTS